MVTVEKAKEISIQLNTFFEKIDLNRKNRNAMFRTMDKRYDIFYKDVAKKYLDFMVNKIVSDIKKRIIKASASSIVTKYVDWEKIEEEGVAIYEPAYVSVMAESGGKAYEQARIEGSFNVFNPLSLSWAAKNSLERVTELTNETKDALREVIAQSMRDKMSRVEIGRQIRELPLGLNLTQTKSYYTYRDSLIADGISDKALGSKMQSYYNELYRGRCDSIAKTEVSRSVNEGYLQALEQQDVFTTVTISSAADCCEECAAREGEEYTIEEAHGILPLHPRCRCAWTVVYEAREKPAPVWKPTMTESEANAWAKGSVYEKEVFYHGTTKGAATEIKEEGFKIANLGDNTKCGGYLGQGHYATLAENEAEFYSTITGKKGQVLKIKTKLSNVLTATNEKEYYQLITDSSLLRNATIVNENLTYAELVADAKLKYDSQLLGTLKTITSKDWEAIKKITRTEKYGIEVTQRYMMKNAGYDGIYIRHELCIFDDASLVVIK